MSKSTPHRILSVLAAAFCLTGLAGCSLITALTSADPDPTPTPTETSAPPEEIVETPVPSDPTTPPPTEEGYPTSLFDLKIGDCFDLPEGSNNASLYSSCDVPHIYEAFGVVTLTDPSWPGEDAVSDKGYDGCVNLFVGYVGTNYSTSAYSIYIIMPSESTWNDMNDREVLCLVYLTDGSQAVDSAADSRR